LTHAGAIGEANLEFPNGVTKRFDLILFTWITPRFDYMVAEAEGYYFFFLTRTTGGGTFKNVSLNTFSKPCLFISNCISRFSLFNFDLV